MKMPATYLFQPWLILAWVLFYQPASSQPGSVDSIHGLCGVSLLASTDTLADFESILKDPDLTGDAYEFAMLGSQYTYLGDKNLSCFGVKARKVFLCTSGQLVIEVRAVFEHDSSLIKTLENLFGKPNIPYKTVTDFENKKAAWSIGMWIGKNTRLLYSAKKYHRKADAEKADVPDYIYLRISSHQADLWFHKKPDEGQR